MEQSDTQFSSQNPSSPAPLPTASGAKEATDKPSMSGMAHDAKEKVQHNTRKMVEQVRHQTGELVEGKKNAVADQVGSIANALRKTAGQLDDQTGSLAQYANSFAGSLDDMAGALHSKDINTLFNQAQDFARRQPAIVLGGAVAAGFLLARFLKSSDKHERSSSEYPPSQSNANSSNWDSTPATNDTWN